MWNFVLLRRDLAPGCADLSPLLTARLRCNFYVYNLDCQVIWCFLWHDDKNSPVLYWIVFTSLRMCLRTCLFAALSWPTVSLLEPYRRCWPTASIQLQRWVTFFYAVQWLPQHIYMLWDPFGFCWDSTVFLCVCCLLCAPPSVNSGASAFLERSMVHLRQTAGVSRLSGFAVNKESMHYHVIKKKWCGL